MSEKGNRRYQKEDTGEHTWQLTALSEAKILPLTSISIPFCMIYHTSNNTYHKDRKESKYSSEYKTYALNVLPREGLVRQIATVTSNKMRSDSG